MAEAWEKAAHSLVIHHIHRIIKSNMIISVDAEKVCGKIQHILMTEITYMIRIEGNFVT